MKKERENYLFIKILKHININIKIICEALKQKAERKGKQYECPYNVLEDEMLYYIPEEEDDEDDFVLLPRESEIVDNFEIINADYKPEKQSKKDRLKQKMYVLADKHNMLKHDSTYHMRHPPKPTWKRWPRYLRTGGKNTHKRSNTRKRSNTHKRSNTRKRSNTHKRSNINA